MALVAAVLQQVLIEPDQRERSTAGGEEPRARGGQEPRPAEAKPLRLWRYMNSSLRQLLVADVLVRFCEQIPFAFVVIWAAGTAALPGPVTALQFGLLRTIEMATAVLVYIPVAHWADRGQKKPFVVATFAFFTLFPVVLLVARSLELLVLAFVIRGLKEFGEPTRKALIMDLAPEGQKAGMLGLYYLVRDVIVAGAAFGGAWLWSLSPQVNLLAACACGVAGTIWFAVRGRSVPGAHEASPA